MNGVDSTVVSQPSGGLVDYSRINGITLQAWSPFQKGFFDGVIFGAQEYPELNAKLDELAAK